MVDEAFSPMRQAMLGDIAAQVIFACGHLGKAALAARVYDALAKVPRHEFVPVQFKPYAYADSPLPIGFGKTVSQPFIVAVMTDLLDVQPGDTVLEVGTGVGYQAAVLAELARRVVTVELIDELAAQARQRLARLGYLNVDVRTGNGALGWREQAPYDKVIVTAAPERIPPALVEQLKPGGTMAIPAGPPDRQQLYRVDKNAAGSVSLKPVFPVRFSVLEADLSTR